LGPKPLCRPHQHHSNWPEIALHSSGGLLNARQNGFRESNEQILRVETQKGCPLHFL
jgi:hypothetical protein